MHARLDLDYKCKPAYTRVGKVLLGVGLLLLLVVGVLYQYLTHLQEQQTLLIQNIPVAPASVSSTITDPRHMEALRHAQEISSKLSAPWETLFQSLETANGRDVAVLTIAAESPSRALKLQAEARDFMAMMRYVYRLQDIAFLRQVQLLSHQVRADDPERPIRFEVSAQWGPEL